MGQNVDFVAAVCDDEKSIVEMLSQTVDDILKETQKTYEIRCFCSGSELLKQASDIQLVFLDIEMPDCDGLTIGSKIHEINPDCTIIMATGREDCYKEAFKIQAFRFVTKPFDRNEIAEAIQAFLDSFRGENTIEAYYNRKLYKIKEKNILYIRAMDSYSEIVLSNQVLRTNESMANLENILDHSLFCRIHKQYIINMSAIEKFCKGYVIINDTKLDISRRKKAEFEAKYLEYQMKFR